MIIGKVIGHLWSTIQEKNFDSYKLMLVKPYNPLTKSLEGVCVLAADNVNAGLGDLVLVLYEGNSSREILKNQKTACEAVIVGVVDEIDIRPQTTDIRLQTPDSGRKNI